MNDYHTQSFQTQEELVTWLNIQQPLDYRIVPTRNNEYIHVIARFNAPACPDARNGGTQ